MSDYENFNEEDLSILDIVNDFKVLFFTNVKTIVFSGIAICLLTGFYLYNTPKEYVTYAKIKVLEEEETSAFVLEDMLNFSSGFNDKELIENEIEIISSKNIIEDKKSGEYRLSHHLDLKTGTYKGRQVLDPKE